MRKHTSVGGGAEADDFGVGVTSSERSHVEGR
jgi:hypothetical protein